MEIEYILSAPSTLNGSEANFFWIKLKRWGLNNCCNGGGFWTKWALIFLETPFSLKKNLNFIKSKNISHTLYNHDVSTKTVCTCITHFANVCKDDFY